MPSIKSCIAALGFLLSIVDCRQTCTVSAGGKSSIDDAPAIRDAFKECGQGGRIVLNETTYHINTVMNTTGLSDVQIDIYGKLVWSTNTTYWLAHSMPLGYQNQSTVWFLGGDKITVDGHGTGEFDGNGQTWYDLVKGESNYPNRPMALTIYKTTDSTIKGLRFINSQMWTMTILHSSNVDLLDMYVNSTSTNSNTAHNTDGADTMFSSQITFRNWTVDNGDDAIALKANSTDILIQDSTFHRGQGVAIGSIGQYSGQYEIIENAVIRNIKLVKTKYVGYVKTWTGVRVNYPPNGGGGGLGHMKNISFVDMSIENGRSSPISFSQCTSYSGASGNCDTSKFAISDITFSNVTGSVYSGTVANMQCSEAAGGCKGVEIEGVKVENLNKDGAAATGYLCDYVVDPVGFKCTGNVTNNDGGS